MSPSGRSIWALTIAVFKTVLYTREQKNYLDLPAKTPSSSSGVFLVLYSWLKCKRPGGSDAYYIANNAIHKTNPLKPFTACSIRKRTMNINLMRSGTHKLTCFPKYMLDYHKHKRLRNTRSVEINVFFTHILKASCVSPPFVITYSFVCWFIFHCFRCRGHVFDVLPWQSLPKGKEGCCCCCMEVKGRRNKHVCLFVAAF